MFKYLAYLTIFLFIIFGIQAAKSKTKGSYWLWLFVPIVVFTITNGLRDGWLVDFTIYQKEYMMFKFHPERLADRYSFIVVGLYKLGYLFDWHFNVIICLLSLIQISLYIAYLWTFRRCIAWILPLFYISHFYMFQFIAFYPAIAAFVLFIGTHQKSKSMFSIKEKNNWLALFFLLVAFGLHKAIIVGLLFYLMVLSKNFNPKWCVALYAASFIFVQDWWYTIVNSSVQVISLVSSSLFERFDYFADGAENFWHDEWGFAANTTTFGMNALTFLANSLAMFFYYNYTCKKGKKLRRFKILELSTIGLILYNITWGVQLIERYAFMLQFFTPIMVSYAIYWGLRNKNKLYIASAIFIAIMNVYMYNRIILNYANPLFKHLLD